MTRSRLVGAALALSAFVVTPALAQVSEPAAAEAQDPNFSIYSNNGYSGVSRPIVSQPFDANAMVGTRMSVTPHRMHHAPIRHH
jgi:hypothetical protein